jgi:alkaline phosphatase
MTPRIRLSIAGALALMCMGAFAQTQPRRAKNVILLLADAGGVSTVNAASLHAHSAPQKLYIQSWPYLGLSDTSPAGRWVSDSAAGMTAIVTGQKTQNGVISQGPDAVRGKTDGTTLKTILEYAEERGLSTGVLSNMTITDATPAACYAHANDRKKFGDIFLEIFSPRFGDGVDVLMGPGRARIYEAVKEKGVNLDELAKSKGRPVHLSLDELPAEAKRGLVVVDGEIDLAAAAKRAVRMLAKNPKGFFLMIESDAHTDDPERGLSRLAAFDKLIREIHQMVNPAETLLLFTADHSFDLRVVGGAGPHEPLLKGVAEWREARAAQMTRGVRLPYVHVDGSHTAEEVIVAATGPGAQRVKGFMPNTRIFEIMMSAYGWSARPSAAGKKK